MSNAAAFAALARIKRSVAALARVPSQTSAAAAPKIQALIEEQFASGTDPYGRAWEPLSQATLDKGRSAPPLTDSGELAGVTVAPMAGAGVSVTLGASYGAFHQVGTRYMPARPILPYAGLPAAWKQALSDAATAAFERTLAEGR